MFVEADPIESPVVNTKIAVSTTPATKSGRLSLDEEAQMMSDFWHLLPTGGGLKTSRWASAEDREVGFAELEAKKAAGKLKTHAAFKQEIEKYKEENPVYFKSSYGSDSSGKALNSPQSTLSSSPNISSPKTLSVAQRKSFRPVSNEGRHWMTLRNDDLLFGPSKPTVSAGIAAQSAATRNQASTLTGESCPFVPLLPAKTDGTGHIRSHMPTPKDREQINEAMQTTMPPVKIESINSMKAEYTPPHLKKRVRQDVPSTDIVEPLANQSQILRSENIPPHLRKRADPDVLSAKTVEPHAKQSPVIGSDTISLQLRNRTTQVLTPVKISELPSQQTFKDYVQSTSPVTSFDDAPRLGKHATQTANQMKTYEIYAQNTSKDEARDTIPASSSNYVMPHLRKRVTPQDSQSAIEGILPSYKTSSFAAICSQTPISIIRPTSPVPPASDKIGKLQKPDIDHVVLAESLDEFSNFKAVHNFAPDKSDNFDQPVFHQLSGCAKTNVHGPESALTDQREIKSISKGAISSSGVDSKMTSPPTTKHYSIEELLQIGDSPEVKKPQHIHAAIMQEISSLAQVKKYAEVVPLTKDALILKTAAAPPKATNSLANASDEDKELMFSDNGHRSSDDGTGPDCRNEIAFEDNGLADWNGGWAAVPASWESERNSYNNSYIPNFIRNWTLKVPKFKSVNITAEKFLSGAAPVYTSRGTLMEAPHQPEARPDLKNSANERRQVIQTAELSSKKLRRQRLKEERVKTQWKICAQEHIESIYKMPTYNPNTPLIPIYLRPARVTDIPGITSIYNHYIQNSIVTEDQDNVSDAQMLEFFKGLRKEYLPFIVAVKGPAPPSGQKTDNEFIVGYSCLIGNFGINLAATRGLRRFTAKIQFFVEPNHLRKGIGRALLDRLLATSTSTHNAKEGYDWVVTEREADEYNNLGYTGGERRYHQLIIELPVEVKDDKTLPWFEEWLRRKFWFKQVALFDYVARTKAGGANTRWLDLAVFQMEASITQCYNVNH